MNAGAGVAAEESKAGPMSRYAPSLAHLCAAALICASCARCIARSGLMDTATRRQRTKGAHHERACHFSTAPVLAGGGRCRSFSLACLRAGSEHPARSVQTLRGLKGAHCWTPGFVSSDGSVTVFTGKAELGQGFSGFSRSAAKSLMFPSHL